MGLIKSLNKVKDKVSSMVSNNDSDDWFDNGEVNDSYDSVQPDNWRWELEFDDLINNYIHTLRKERRNSKGQWLRKPDEIPFMNEEGIAFVISSLQPIMNKGTPMGSITLKEANDITSILSRSFKQKLILDYEEFDIKKNNISMLVWGFSIQVKMILTRAKNDGERKIRAKIFGFKDNYHHDEVNAEEIKGSFKL